MAKYYKTNSYSPRFEILNVMRQFYMQSSSAALAMAEYDGKMSLGDEFGDILAIFTRKGNLENRITTFRSIELTF